MEIQILEIVILILLVLFIVFLLNVRVSWRRQDNEDEPQTASYSFEGRTPLQTTDALAEKRKARWTSLTLRERTVALLAAEGKSNDEIARELGISRRTVEKHLENAYAKLHIRSRGALPLVLPENSHTQDLDFPDEKDTA